MAYATVEQLAAAMRLTVTPKNTDWLQSCIDAAASEIDHALGLASPLPDPPDALATVVNVARGVEWWKANDATFGGVGFADTGILAVKPDGFERHAIALIPLTESFGLA